MSDKKTALITGACINTGVAIVEKFACEGYDVVFTGRDAQRVEIALKRYREKFPNVNFYSFVMDSLIDERTVDEKSVQAMFEDLDKKGVFVETLVCNAADQGLGIKALENPLTFNLFQHQGTFQ